MRLHIPSELATGVLLSWQKLNFFISGQYEGMQTAMAASAKIRLAHAINQVKPVVNAGGKVGDQPGSQDFEHSNQSHSYASMLK